MELLIGNSLWRNYTEEGVRNIEANVAMNLRLGYANRINPTVEGVLESVYQAGENILRRDRAICSTYFVTRERERKAAPLTSLQSNTDKTGKLKDSDGQWYFMLSFISRAFPFGHTARPIILLMAN